MKTYAKGINIKSITTKYGQIIKVGIKVDLFKEFLEQNQNEKGFVNLDILERRERGKYGETHYAVLNEYKKPSYEPNKFESPIDDDLKF